jgi:hypothetical protein
MKRRILLIGLAMTLAYGAFADTTAATSQPPPQSALYTRVILITAETSRSLKQVKGLDAKKPTKDLLMDYLKQNGVESGPQMHCHFDPTNQTLQIRATLAVLDKVQSLLAKLGRTQSGTLSPTDAAQLAAKLANDECERLYKRRPFAAGQHPAVQGEGEYHWGGLDVGAPGGYSAQVTFGQDGSRPKVEVYFSTDRR